MSKCSWKYHFLTISYFGSLVSLFRTCYIIENMIIIYAFLQSNDSDNFLFCYSERKKKTIVWNTTKAHICSCASSRLFWLHQAFQGMTVNVHAKPHPFLVQTHLAFLSVSLSSVAAWELTVEETVLLQFVIKVNENTLPMPTCIETQSIR